MSILIKGMEMPENCAECKFFCFENFKLWCHVTDREDIYIDALPDWCPLVELPEKHGRLIDADALITKRGGLAVDSENIVELSPGWTIPLESVIDIEPTVVEAEDK